MSDDELVKELKSCLELQNEIDAKTLELRKRYKTIVEAHIDIGTVYVEIEDDTYALERSTLEQDEHRDAMDTARKLKGFYLYRLVKKGKTIR